MLQQEDNHPAIESKEVSNFSILSVVISIILLILIIVAIVATLYIIKTKDIGESFTEFYMLGLDGKADNYPTEAKVNTDTAVILGVVNREHARMNYHIEIYIDSSINNEIGPITLDNQEKWEEVNTFTPNQTGDNQKVEFFLFKDQESDPYLSLILWVNVTTD